MEILRYIGSGEVAKRLGMTLFEFRNWVSCERIFPDAEFYNRTHWTALWVPQRVEYLMALRARKIQSPTYLLTNGH
jgi:hypothetical protein